MRLGRISIQLLFPKKCMTFVIAKMQKSLGIAVTELEESTVGLNGKDLHGNHQRFFELFNKTSNEDFILKL